MSRLSRARRKLRHLHAAYKTPRPRKIRHRILKLVAHIRYLSKLTFDGQPSNVSHLLYPVIVLAHECGLYLTSTTGGTHAPGSWHYPGNNADGLGHAIDFAGSYDAMIRFQSRATNKFPRALEIFGPDAYYVKNGVRYSGAFPDHGDHVHVAR